MPSEFGHLDELTMDTAAISESLQFIIPIILLLIICITGLILNFLIILATILSKRLQSPTNLFIFSLSLSDLLLCAVPCTFYAYSALYKDFKSGPFCGIASSVIHICTLQTLFSFPLIAYNRFVLVVRSRQRYLRCYTMFNSITMVLGSWVLAIGVVLIILFLHPLEFDYYPSKRICVNPASTPAISIMELCTLVLCFTLALRSYIEIYTHLRKATGKATSIPTSNQIRNRKAKVKVTKNMFWVTAVFCVCCLPITVLRVVDMKAKLVASFWHRMFRILFFISGVANPLIYAARHQLYKDAIRSILQCKRPDKIYMDSLRRIAKRSRREKETRIRTLTTGSSLETGSTDIEEKNAVNKSTYEMVVTTTVKT
ncbi:QRFP-like peptide receptor [Lineus longissimus]|uniref:QRFP-like peptide receptor n=1 Tax=Lineus longissimus TaxID=88925 RepID=UPI00315DD38E